MFPQAEHARFAGALALNWAEPPPLPFASFVRGVADHDRGYGELDDDPLGEVAEERWLEIQRRGFAPRGEDPVVDLVVVLHVRRLLHEGPAFDEVDALLPTLLSAAGVSRADAELADAITNVCDVISLGFCFEEPLEREVRGYRVVLDGGGRIEVDPWPFAVPLLAGLVTSYQSDGYPRRLIAVVAPFEARPLQPIAR